MILVFGTICLDRIRRVDSWPKTGGYVEVLEETVLLGGEASNTANALQMWGDAPVLVGNPLGGSSDGDLLRQMLTSRGLNAVELTKPEFEYAQLETPVCDVYVSEDGDRTMFGKGFASMERFSSAAAVPWSPGGWFTAEPNMENLSREAARLARNREMHLYLMDFVRPDDPVFPGSYWQSSTDWAGVRNNTQKNVQWVKRWVAEKECFAILSDGPNGFVAGSPFLPVRAYPPFPAPDVVDTTGAGDVFRAGMLHGLSLGWETSECLRFASAAGCLKCRTLGATTAVPTITEIEAHIGANPDVARQY